jgi:hypothetical protein
MATQPLDTGAAMLFNDHMKDLGNRIGTFCNYLMLVDGGILSITIGAFISATPPSLAMDGLLAIRAGWYLITLGLVLALAVTFFVLWGQLVVQRKLNDSFNAQPTALQLHRGPSWVGTAVRWALVMAFTTSVAGIACVSYGAVQMLRIPAAAPAK